MEHQHPHQGGEHLYPGVNSYGTNDPAVQAEIEQARAAASAERRAARERFERYVETGVNPEDATVAVEFADVVHDRQTRLEPGHQSEPVVAGQPETVGGPHHLWPADPPREDRAPEASDSPDSDRSRKGNAGTRACAMGERALSVIVQLDIPEDEADTFPWVDAATWSPRDSASQDVGAARHSSEELGELFAESIDDEVGTVAEMGWYGRVKHQDKPGGLILVQDERGVRHVRDVQTDEALELQWQAVQAAYETYYHQRDAYELATTEADDAPSGVNPRIWVGSLSDYNAGLLYGEWLNAALEPEDLEAAVGWLLRHSPSRNAEEYGIFDFENFGGYQIEQYASLMTASLIAKGIAEHGLAFAAWVAYVGDTSGDLLDSDRFQSGYLGEFDSVEAYVEYVLQETDFDERLDKALSFLPEDVRRYVKVDVEGLAEEWGQYLHMDDAPNGGVYLFDGRA